MNKREWRKRYREQREITKSWIKYADRKEAACNELRRDAVRLATELARVQGVCEATQAQVLKHAVTITDLREREKEETC